MKKFMFIFLIFFVTSCMMDKAFIIRTISVTTEPEGAKVECNDSLIDRSPCQFQVEVPMKRGCCLSGGYSPIYGKNFITAYTITGEQFGKTIMLTNDELMKSALSYHLSLEPISPARIESTKTAISKMMKRVYRSITPKIYVDLFNIAIYYGYHAGQDDYNTTGLAFGRTAIDIKYFLNNRWGLGFTFAERVDALDDYNYSHIILNPIATFSISYASYMGLNAFQLFTLSFRPPVWEALVQGWSFMMEHSFVPFAPWPIEWRSRAGWTQEGKEFATGFRMGLGFWWIKY